MLINSKKAIIDSGDVIVKLRAGCSLILLAQEIGIHRNTLSSYLRELGYTKSKVKFNHNFFYCIDTETKAYWLGFIMADGCVSRTHSDKVMVTAAAKDAAHLQNFHDAIDSCVRVQIRNNVAISQHYSTQLCNDLVNLGCTPRKSLTLQFPSIDPRLTHHFVRGYFDGDGCASLHNKKQKTPQLRVNFVGTESFLERLSEIVGVSNKLRPVGNNKKVRALEVTGNKKASSLAKWMYQDATIYLQRKREVVNACVLV